jgi:DNA recombination protein Rad52
MNAEATVHEQASLQDYQLPGFYAVQQNYVGNAEFKQAQYVRNPCDGAILSDHNGNPVSIGKMLATRPLRGEISTRMGASNRKMPYLSGEQVSRSLNDIFGYDGWDLTVLRVQREEQLKEHGKYTVCYAAHVRVTIRASGAFREDWGTREATDKNFGKAIDTALKGSVTDALKRAAKHFGDKLGNDIGTLNTAPTTLQQALDAYDIAQANTKFGFKNKNNATPPPLPQATHDSAMPTAKALAVQGTTTTSASAVIHSSSHNSKLALMPVAHPQKCIATTCPIEEMQKEVPPPPSRPSGQHRAQMDSASTTLALNAGIAPIARPTSSYGRPNNNNHFTNKPPISVGPLAPAAATSSDNSRRVSLDLPTFGCNGNPTNMHHQQGQASSLLVAVQGVQSINMETMNRMQANEAAKASSMMQQPTTHPHKRPPLHSLPTNDGTDAEAAPTNVQSITPRPQQQPQHQPVKRPASMMTNPYSHQNSYPNKNGGGSSRHSL